MARPRRTGEPIIGGQALKAAIHVARARAGIPSDVQLTRVSGVSYDTLMNWYAERTVPRPHELKKVATALGTSYAELMEVYEGRGAQPVPLDQAIRELAAEIRVTRQAQDSHVAALVGAVEALLRRETPEDEPESTPAPTEPPRAYRRRRRTDPDPDPVTA